MNDIQLTIRLPRELLDKLKALAEAEHRSVSNMIRVIIREAVTKRKDRQ